MFAPTLAAYIGTFKEQKVATSVSLRIFPSQGSSIRRADMRRDYFMSYFADPFSLSEPIVAIKEQDAPAPHIVAFSELANMEGHFYTFQGALFVEALRTRQLELLPIVDVRHALQLASGRSRRNFERSEWAFREWLRLTN